MKEYKLNDQDLNYIADLTKECWLNTQKGNIVCTIESFLALLGAKKLVVRNGVIYEQE